MPGQEVAVLLPVLPATGGQPEPDRYGIGRLTAAWLGGYATNTRLAYARDLAHFLGWCQQQRLDPLAARPADLDLYRMELLGRADRPPTAATLHRRLSGISSWYRYLLANRAAPDLTGNPVAGIRRPRLDRDSSPTAGLTTAEVRALLRCADARAAQWRGGAELPPGKRRRALAALRDRALLRLLADLGLRVGEALGLDVAALSHNRGRRTVRFVGKGGRVRERPLPAAVTEALDEYLAARAAYGGHSPADLVGPLFATTARGGGPAGRMDEPAAFRLVRRLARQAGLPAAGRLSPHSLRHAFATNAREIGIALEDVQDAMGHADTRTTRRYDRDRYALERDPALRLGELYTAGGGR